MSLHVIILAAGEGKRMHSHLPKVLHTIGSQSMLTHVIRAAHALQPKNIFIVHGAQKALLQQHCPAMALQWIAQPRPRGTADAVAHVLPHLPDAADQVVMLAGDVPLIQTTTLQQLLKTTTDNALGLCSATVANPYGFGRILRDEKNHIQGIVEEKDATPQQRLIQEINTSIYCTSVKNLQRWLPQISPHNQQQELYLTDMVQLAAAEQLPIVDVRVTDVEEILGVNDRWQLAQRERAWQQRQVEHLAKKGVTFLDPQRVDIRGEVVFLAADVTIDINVILAGEIHIGAHSVIGANCYLQNVRIGKNVRIEPNCVLENVTISDDCVIGPFARLRPGTQLAEHVKIGNFVEIKNAQVQAYSKIPHLSYIGDADIGRQVNIGAGVITVNYDGVHKHRTTIGDRAFIGCDSQLIAPVTIGSGAYIAAGSTINKDAPAESLTICRARDQRTVRRWQRPGKHTEEQQ